MKKDLDEILKYALTPNEEPDFWLNQKIQNRINQKERTSSDMKKSGKKIQAAIISMAAILGIGSATTYAAWRLLTPGRAAMEVGDYKLKETFESSDAVQINETQVYGDYRVTLLGIASGKDIADYLTPTDGGEPAGQTYSVVAIEHADGTPMPDTADDDYGEESFLVSPLIKGCAPHLYNAFTLGGGYSDTVEDGVLYRISECDNVEIFADRGLYLCVTDSTFYNVEAYNYNEETGEITRNDSYQGLNALFELPIDPAKADPAAAEECIKKIDNPDEEEPYEPSPEETEVDSFVKQLTSENIHEYCDAVESTKQVLKRGENGIIKVKGWEVEGRVSAEDGEFFLPEDAKTGQLQIIGWSGDGTLDGLVIETCVLNEDDTVSFLVYIPKK